jgi:hypothetical protein
LQNQKLVFNVNEIGKDIKKVERDVIGLGYKTSITIKQLTQEVSRTNIVSGRNIFKFDEETDE